MYRLAEWGLRQWLGGKKSAWQRRHEFNPWVGKNRWRRKWQPTPVFLPGEFRGQRSLAVYSPRDRNELNTNERSITCAQGLLNIPENCYFSTNSSFLITCCCFLMEEFEYLIWVTTALFLCYKKIRRTFLTIRWLRDRTPDSRARFDPWRGNRSCMLSGGA